MTCTLLSKTTGLELDCYDNDLASLFNAPVEESYETAPMMVVSVMDRHDDEEELHTSFEQAISGRVSALQGRLSRISGQQPVVRYQTDPLMQVPASQLPQDEARHTFAGGLRQRGIVLASLALSCAMLGFDLMGQLKANDART